MHDGIESTAPRSSPHPAGPGAPEGARIDAARLRGDIDALSRIGRGEDGGIHRPAFGRADMQARQWLLDRLEVAGIPGRMDEAGNVIGRLGEPGRPCVMIGSHLDSVPGGGHLDGALGVCVGLECLRALQEQGDLPADVAFECIGFSDEEGRFGGMVGSPAIAGQLTPEILLNACDPSGRGLVECMREAGLDALSALHAKRRPEDIRAFLELHIEQGPVLDRLGHSVGLVEAISGLFRWNVRFVGTPNHAGTTPMSMRQDAFSGAADAAAALERILEEHGGRSSVATIGRIELQPGAPNVVPGSAELSLDVRDADPETLVALADAIRRAFGAIARRRGLMFEFEVLSEIAPVGCDSGVQDAVRQASLELGVDPHPIVSGAAHDAQIMASITRVGMIFIPSKEGRSHSPAEWSDWHDIELGANVALRTLLRLA